MLPEATAPSHLLSLADVAARSTTSAEFEASLRDCLRALRERSTRAGVAATIADEPPPLADRFAGGDAASDHLAACARLIAAAARLTVPSWAMAPQRDRAIPRSSPVEADHSAPVEISLGIRPGRPSVSIEHKRRTNAGRQRRFRARRAAEWQQLRHTGTAGRKHAPSAPSIPVRADITLDLQTLP